MALANGRGRKLPMKQLPRLPGSATAEERYWKSFRHPLAVKHAAAVASLQFCAAAPHRLAAAAGLAVHVYDADSGAAAKTVSRFKETVRCAALRGDGRLLAAGGDDCRLQLFDMASRAVLRSFAGHGGAVQAAAWLPLAPTRLLSASADCSLRLWDAAADAALLTLPGHSDAVRAAAAHPQAAAVAASASYDHRARLWDLRAPSAPTLEVDHGAPVEAVAFFPSGAAMATAGGAVVRVWDLLAGGRLLAELANHQKTVTALCLDGSGSRLFSASLDHHVKVYDVRDFSVTHSIKYPAPVLSVAVDAANSKLAAGLADGVLSIRRRIEHVADEEGAWGEQRRRKRLDRGKERKPEPGDHVVLAAPKVRLQPYEAMLRKFQYREALDAALATRNPVVVVSFLEELLHRSSLARALAGRDDQELEPVLAFLSKYLTNPRYNAVLFPTAHALLDCYSRVVGQSALLDDALFGLRAKLHKELRTQQDLQQLAGALELLGAAPR